jgi:uncharacterized protein (DUF1697 family)
MPRYVAFLRGVMPSNAKMAELRHAVERAGFSEIRTVLSSGNVVFSTTRAASEPALARRVEAAMAAHLDRTFSAIVRSAEDLQELVRADAFAAFRIRPGAKCVVTFFPHAPRPRPALPIERDGARILAATDREAFTAYLPHPRGPVFMSLIEEIFGSGVTTRTWDTVKKCAAASRPAVEPRRRAPPRS